MIDTTRSTNLPLRSNKSNAATDVGSTYFSSFNNNGFTVGSNGSTNYTGVDFTSWSFRKSKGFFDIVTYTGTGSNRDIAHSLGSIPGMIIVKNTSDAGESWRVYHRGMGSGSPQNYVMYLNTENPESTEANTWNQTAPTASTFRVGTDHAVNKNGSTYVAYIFAGGDATNIDIKSSDFMTKISNLNKKIPYLIIFLTLLGCSTMKIDDFANTEPEFNLMQFFEGNVEAWGIVEDRFGNLKRQFKVDMNGTIKDGVLTLEEDFIYADGEKDKRIWQFSKLDESSYKGLANDIIGEAIAKERGNAFNMKYKMDLDLGFSVLRVGFNDWMYRIDKETIINKASISKFGFNIATVTLFFRKKT